MQFEVIIPTMKDRAMQALYLLALQPIAECTADRNSYGFRPKRSVADAIEQCFAALSRHDCAPWILEGDIKGCFDNISHDWLIAHAPIEKAILRKWLKAGFIEANALWPTEAGTPQGGITTPRTQKVTLAVWGAGGPTRSGWAATSRGRRRNRNTVSDDDVVITD